VITQALNDAERANIRGQAITPYLLQRVSELTQGESIQAIWLYYTITPK
jgi:pseudouridine-5'-phosphate glycosidase